MVGSAIVLKSGTRIEIVDASVLEARIAGNALDDLRFSA